jgi:hypothetical protein
MTTFKVPDYSIFVDPKTGKLTREAVRFLESLLVRAGGVGGSNAIEALRRLTPAADKVPYFTSSSAAALTDFPAFGRTLVGNASAGDALSDLGVSAFIQTLLNDANAATARATLGVTDLFGALSLADYTALRAYEGESERVYITGFVDGGTPLGISGFFIYAESDVTSTDNGGTLIVGDDGRRWKRVIDGPWNVKWFGAKGDGSNDDTAEIQACIDAVSALGGGSVLIPEGTYQLSAAIEIPSYVSVYGEGIEATILRAKATSTATEVVKNQPTTATNGTLYGGLFHMTLQGNSACTSGLRLDAWNRATFERIRVRSVTAAGAVAFRLQTWEDGGGVWRVCSRNSFRDCLTLDAPNSMIFTKAAGDPSTHGCNLNLVERCYFAGYDTKGIFIEYGEGNNFNGISCTTSNDNTVAIYVNDTVCKFTACHVDSTAGASMATTTDAWGFPTGVLDNANTGIYFSDTARGGHVDVLLGNGCRKRIDYQSATAFHGTNVTRWQYNYIGETRGYSALFDAAMWLGTEGSEAYRFWNDAPIADGGGGTTAGAFAATGLVQAGASTTGVGFASAISLAASVATTNLRHFSAAQPAFGAGASATDQVGFYVNGSLTGATNNYSFKCDLNAATGRWNFFADGTAPNRYDGPSLFADTTYGAQGSATAKTAAATLTGAEVLGGIITYNGVAADLTLPTGTDLDAAITADIVASALPINMFFDFSVINTGAATVTVALNTDITATGTRTVAAGTSGRFRLRKTATGPSTFILYRLA